MYTLKTHIVFFIAFSAVEDSAPVLLKYLEELLKVFLRNEACASRIFPLYFLLFEFQDRLLEMEKIAKIPRHL
jgi:hypothetical protein